MRKLNKDINIFVACHKDFYVPENKYLIPVQVGAEFAKTKLDMHADNTGDNISKLNPSFCELTAQYWAWKNVDCEYYGFFHYRRYLSFADYVGPKHAAYSDLYFENITDGVLKDLNLEESYMKELIENYDIILPKKAELKYEKKSMNTLYKHYKESPQHNIKDLENTIKIIHELYPEFDKYVKKAIYGNEMYFLNMYIMKKKYFFEYMEWLFPILNKFHEQKDYSNASIYENRTPGLISERLVPVFMLFLKDKYKDLKIKELQNTFFYDVADPYLKPINKNGVGICLATDNNYAKHLGVALQSIVDNSSEKNIYDIIVFDNNISFSNKDLILKTIKGHKNFSLRFIKTGEFLKNKKLFGRAHVTISTYLRFAMLDILRNYSKIVYLDCDLVVNKDINDLCSVDLGKNYVGAVRDCLIAAWNNQPNERGKRERDYYINVLGMSNPFDYFNAGVMVYNIEEMRKNISTEKLFDIATERVYRWQDQDILNKVCFGKVLFLESNWNYMTNRNVENPELLEFPAPKTYFDQFSKAKSDPYIVHYAGHKQPMYCPDVNYGELFWKYARNSLFYEEMLAERFASHGENVKPKFKTRIKWKLMKWFPKGTRRGDFARRIFHIFKKG